MKKKPITKKVSKKKAIKKARKKSTTKKRRGPSPNQTANILVDGAYRFKKGNKLNKLFFDSHDIILQIVD